MSRIRLICPNCGAQYEVPAEVIPEGGRDVQCSNCAHTWFQNHPGDDPLLSEELGEPADPEEWEPEDEGDDDDALEDDAPPTPEAALFDEEDDDDFADPPAMPQTRRRSLDPEIAEVLREEAERERRQRQAEAEAFEMQPDLGLAEPDEDEQARRAREARARMAHIRGEDLARETEAEVEAEPEAETAPAPEPAPDAPPRRRERRPADLSDSTGRSASSSAAAVESRRELLPDVEEINQTLRATSDRRVTDSEEGRVSVSDETPARGGGGFARGFFLIVMLVAIALAVYVSAPQIKSAAPQAAPMIDSYVDKVDSLRLWLDEQVTGLMTSLDSMSSENAAEPETAPAE
ncbi:zinc-ribbon domain-containing protein [Primorskyibacter sp. 2E107]|uniref:zinc-ribbon domain-containing protein n=1 Tax=Primorskyibacter sp. 2E107 TaxID=3403458 RepID=UPI003AF8398E